MEIWLRLPIVVAIWRTQTSGVILIYGYGDQFNVLIPLSLSNFEAFNIIVNSVFGYWTFVIPVVLYSTGIVIGVVAFTLLTLLISYGTYIMV